MLSIKKDENYYYNNFKLHWNNKNYYNNIKLHLNDENYYIT